MGILYDPGFRVQDLGFRGLNSLTELYRGVYRDSYRVYYGGY